MFGGLHIERLRPETHSKLLDGSGLCRFLNWSNLITGAGNVMRYVSSITSARYLPQVCLCAEFKAMKTVFETEESKLDIHEWWIYHVSLLDYALHLPDSDTAVPTCKMREGFSLICECEKVINETYFCLQSFQLRTLTLTVTITHNYLHSD